MVKIHRHGDTFATMNPATGEWQEMTNVVFIEEGRNGANRSLSDSSRALAEAAGIEDVGLANTRTHTQPVRSDKIGEFPIGKEFDLHINREMWSTPQMANQEDKVPRIIDGKITYFKTELSKTMEEDRDYRTVVLTTADMVPQELINQATRSLRATQVKTINRAPRPVAQTAPTERTAQ